MSLNKIEEEANKDRALRAIDGVIEIFILEMKKSLDDGNLVKFAKLGELCTQVKNMVPVNVPKDAPTTEVNDRLCTLEKKVDTLNLMLSSLDGANILKVGDSEILVFSVPEQYLQDIDEFTRELESIFKDYNVLVIPETMNMFLVSKGIVDDTGD